MAGTLTQGCAGCGAELAPSKSKPRKWCSEKCRKGSYGDPCVDCGARTVYGAEIARVPEPHCDPCRRRRDADRRCEKAMAMLKLRLAGLTNVEIGRAVGISNLGVATELCRLRSIGFDVPASPYRNASVKDGPLATQPEAFVLARELRERGITPTTPPSLVEHPPANTGGPDGS